MFTVVNHQEFEHRRRNVGEPRPEILNHREKETKSWSEKMRNEETTYKHLKKHRDELLESELMYKKTIKELEKEKAELITIYEPTYSENKVLKSVLAHGPDAVKMKKLQKARKELGEEVDALKDENKKLTEQMQEMIKKNKKARDIVLEKNWKDVLVKNKKKKEKNGETLTQGPFPSKEVDRNTTLIEKDIINEADVYDLQLDTVEKEIQILLNNVKYIKKQKEKLDYAISMGKGAIVRNSVLENAIHDKLDEDLKTFKGNLKNAKRKHNEIKQKIEQKEKDVTENGIEGKEDAGKKSFKSAALDITKTYKTSETQTDGQTGLKYDGSDNLTNQLKSHKKINMNSQSNRAIQTDFPKTVKILKENKEINRAIQTDFPKPDQVRNAKKERNRAIQTDFSPREQEVKASKETMTYLDQYENKKTKLREAKEVSQKVSSRRVRTEYAKKLVVRRGASPNRIEDTFQEPVDKSQRKDTKYKNKFVPVKRNQAVKCSNRDKVEERLPALKKANISNTRTNLICARPKSECNDNHKQNISDYDDMIMIPKIEVVQMIKQTYTNKTRNNFKNAKIKSRSSVDVRRTESVSKQVQESLPGTYRYSNDPVLGDAHSWKSESDLLDYADKQMKSVQPVKEFNYIVPMQNNFVHLKGGLENNEMEKRDESAYDEVLADLQKRHSAQDVSKEFERTAQTFREYKDTVRKKTKRQQNISGLFPSIVPQEPIRFTSDSRQVSAGELMLLLKNRKTRYT